MKGRTITITGGSGFVGQILRPGLRAMGWRIRIFDQFRGPLLDLLRHRFLAASTSPAALKRARQIKKLARRAEGALLATPLIPRRADHILDLRSRLAESFRGCDAVIHLAGLPHARFEGAGASDFQRINYEGSVNVFEAAREAGVRKFLFASSCQVYKINEPVRLDQFPILETNYCPDLSEGQSHYGWWKHQFEQYMAEACGPGGMEGIALRLEMPGMRSIFAFNFYVSTSVENLIDGFAAALNAERGPGFDAFNLVDGAVDPGIVDIQKFIAANWPDVPNKTSGNECLMSVEKARRILKYDPKPGGTYYDFQTVWE